MLDKTERMNQLLDCYAVLLTDKQLDMMNLYYKEDLSLAEIAENCAVTRSAVHDSLKRCEKSLEAYEEKLRMLDKSNQRMEIYQQLRDLHQPEVDELIMKCESTE